MKTFALALALACPVALADLPATNPEAAIFVTDCHQIVVAVIVMPDGTSMAFDRHSKESADSVKQLAARARTPAKVYELGCTSGIPT
jgi:hypothetical protein